MALAYPRRGWEVIRTAKLGVRGKKEKEEKPLRFGSREVACEPAGCFRSEVFIRHVLASTPHEAKTRLRAKQARSSSINKRGGLRCLAMCRTKRIIVLQCRELGSIDASVRMARRDHPVLLTVTIQVIEYHGLA